MLRIARIFRNLLLDFRYQKRYIRGTRISRPDLSGINNETPTDPFVLDLLFRNIRIKKDDILVDIGCGRGRVINWWLSQGLQNRIIGIEIDSEIADNTKKRLRIHNNVKIVTANAAEFIINEGSIFYLFNPFDHNLMKQFSKNMKSAFQDDRHIQIFYYNCVCINVFASDPFWNVEMFDFPKKGFHKAALITNNQQNYIHPY